MCFASRYTDGQKVRFRDRPSGFRAIVAVRLPSRRPLATRADARARRCDARVQRTLHRAQRSRARGFAHPGAPQRVQHAAHALPTGMPHAPARARPDNACSAVAFGAPHYAPAAHAARPVLCARARALRRRPTDMRTPPPQVVHPQRFGVGVMRRRQAGAQRMPRVGFVAGVLRCVANARVTRPRGLASPPLFPLARRPDGLERSLLPLPWHAVVLLGAFARFVLAGLACRRP